MDVKNPYESPVTFRLHRAEYVAGFVASIVMIVIHWNQIRWGVWIGLFLYIDLIGYIPGAIAFRRSPDHRIHKTYYVLYNSMHSLITCAIVAGLWMWLVKPEWALLALPFHVLGDRGVFGNFLKPFGRPFEPVANPRFEHVVDDIRLCSVGTRMPAPRVEDAETPAMKAAR